MNADQTVVERVIWDRSPDWRWRRAVRLVDHGRRLSRRRDDGQVCEAVHFLRELRRLGGESTPDFTRRHPALAAAHALYAAGESWPRSELEARLLTDESFGQIAARSGMSDATVAAYHDLFFDVRHRLHASDWVAVHALGRDGRIGFADGDAGRLLKAYAYSGGTSVLESLLEYYRDPPVVPDRPETLEPDAFRTLCNKLLITASILGRTTSADDPRALKRLMLVRQATEQLRHAAETVKSDGEPSRSLGGTFDLDAGFAPPATVTPMRRAKKRSPVRRVNARSSTKVA
jgi:hypothetical protein